MKIFRSKILMTILLIVSLYLFFYVVSSRILSGKVEAEKDRILKSDGSSHKLPAIKKR
ncbi:MAG: hypothetical protein M1536_07520 [Firmicutes bacterium]|nr:hypothetical protein [Bacillota bacterium]